MTMNDQQSGRAKEGTSLFEFDHQEDRRKAFPYACRLYLDQNGELEREFFDLDRDWIGKHDVRVSGEYEAEVGDVIEELSGGSWKNKYRGFYLISPAGEKVQIAGGKAEIRKYLKGKLAAEDMVYGSDRDKFVSAGGRRGELEAERDCLQAELEQLQGELDVVEKKLAEAVPAEQTVAVESEQT